MGEAPSTYRGPWPCPSHSGAQGSCPHVVGVGVRHRRSGSGPGREPTPRGGRGLTRSPRQVRGLRGSGNCISKSTQESRGQRLLGETGLEGKGGGQEPDNTRQSDLPMQDAGGATPCPVQEAGRPSPVPRPLPSPLCTRTAHEWHRGEKSQHPFGRCRTGIS